MVGLHIKQGYVKKQGKEPSHCTIVMSSIFGNNTDAGAHVGMGTWGLSKSHAKTVWRPQNFVGLQNSLHGLVIFR